MMTTSCLVTMNKRRTWAFTTAVFFHVFFEDEKSLRVGTSVSFLLVSSFRNC
jgi:hypothetical protein